MGDALPSAVQIFSRSLNVSEAELFKLMEQGKLLSSEVLPKVAEEFRKSALAGGAYGQALKGLRVTEGQLVTEGQRAGNTIFKSGFEEGLSQLYKTISELLKTSGPQLEKIGSIFGKVFKGIAYAIKLLEPVMKVAIDNFEVLFGALAIYKLQAFATAANMSLARAFLPITVALAAAEELASLMSDKLVGNIEERMGMQINFGDKTTSKLTERDGKLFADGKKNPFFGLGSFGEYSSKFMDFTNPVTQAKQGFSSLSSMFSSATTTNNSGGNTYIFQNNTVDDIKRLITYTGATSGMPATK